MFRISEKQQSIVLDGILVAAVLYLLMLMLELLIQPILVMSGRPGLLIYSLVILVISILFLDRSFHVGWGIDQARTGLIGGVLGWVFISSIDVLIGLFTTTAQSFFWLLFCSLFVAVLWKRVFPLGVRFYLLAVLLNWLGHFLVAGADMMDWIGQVGELPMDLVGWVAIAGAAVSMAYIFLGEKSRVQRAGGALSLCIFLMIALKIYLQVSL
ncbi:MAG TPA: hypothetical protein PKN11_03410 [Anaerolineaceae bacterium]|nr:hypothetical protein [Anaerolineaceae bacterium]